MPFFETEPSTSRGGGGGGNQQNGMNEEDGGGRSGPSNGGQENQQAAAENLEQVRIWDLLEPGDGDGYFDFDRDPDDDEDGYFNGRPDWWWREYNKLGNLVGEEKMKIEQARVRPKRVRRKMWTYVGVVSHVKKGCISGPASVKSSRIKKLRAKIANIPIPTRACEPFESYTGGENMDLNEIAPPKAIATATATSSNAVEKRRIGHVKKGSLSGPACRKARLLKKMRGIEASCSKYTPYRAGDYSEFIMEGALPVPDESAYPEDGPSRMPGNAPLI